MDVPHKLDTCIRAPSKSSGSCTTNLNADAKWDMEGILKELEVIVLQEELKWKPILRLTTELYEDSAYFTWLTSLNKSTNHATKEKRIHSASSIEIDGS